MYPWWELLSGAYSLSVQPVSGATSASAGDLVTGDTYYNLGNHRFEFRWSNLTTGFVVPTLYITSLYQSSTGITYPAAQFYSGHSVEAVVENAGDLAEYGYNGFGGVYGAKAGQVAAPIGNFNYNLLQLYKGSDYLAGVANGAMANSTDFSVHWLACH